MNMPRLKAQDLLDKARAGEVSLKAEGWHDVTLLATGDKEQAERAMKAFIQASRDAGKEPE